MLFEKIAAREIDEKRMITGGDLRTLSIRKRPDRGIPPAGRRP